MVVCKLWRNNPDRLNYKYYWSQTLANKYITILVNFTTDTLIHWSSEVMQWYLWDCCTVVRTGLNTTNREGALGQQTEPAEADWTQQTFSWHRQSQARTRHRHPDREREEHRQGDFRWQESQLSFLLYLVVTFVTWFYTTFLLPCCQLINLGEVQKFKYQILKYRYFTRSQIFVIVELQNRQNR